MMHRLLPAIYLLSSMATLSADTLYLRDGRTVDGKLVSATSRQDALPVGGRAHGTHLPADKH